MKSEEMVTGYQVMADGSYGGAYQFPRNMNSEEIHWPPNTVSIAPPEALLAGSEHHWSGEAWVSRRISRFNGDNTDVPNPLYEASVAARTEEERLMFLPVPTGRPVKGANGFFPMMRLNADKTAWEWYWPEAESE